MIDQKPAPNFFDLINAITSGLPQEKQTEIKAQINKLLSYTLVSAVLDNLPADKHLLLKERIKQSIAKKEPIEKVIDPFLEDEQLMTMVQQELVKSMEKVIQSLQDSLKK